MTQIGLPPGIALTVGVFDADTTRRLADPAIHSDRTGRIDLRIDVALTGVRRLVVEVTRTGDENVEYGEADTTLHLPCTPPPPRPSTGPGGGGSSAGGPAGGVAARTGPSASSSSPGRFAPVLLIAGLVLAAGGTVIVTGRRPARFVHRWAARLRR